MPSFTGEAVPTDADELAFLKAVLQLGVATARLRGKPRGQFCLSHPVRHRMSPRQHVVATPPGLSQAAAIEHPETKR